MKSLPFPARKAVLPTPPASLQMSYDYTIRVPKAGAPRKLGDRWRGIALKTCLLPESGLKRMSEIDLEQHLALRLPGVTVN